jgi:hypothetical protein
VCLYEAIFGIKSVFIIKGKLRYSHNVLVVNLKANVLLNRHEAHMVVLESEHAPLLCAVLGLVVDLSQQGLAILVKEIRWLEPDNTAVNLRMGFVDPLPHCASSDFLVDLCRIIEELNVFFELLFVSAFGPVIIWTHDPFDVHLRNKYYVLKAVAFLQPAQIMANQSQA